MFSNNISSYPTQKEIYQFSCKYLLFLNKNMNGFYIFEEIQLQCNLQSSNKKFKSNIWIKSSFMN